MSALPDGESPIDDALRHAGEVLASAGGSQYANVRTAVLWLLVSWIQVVRPVPSAHADDFNRWQDDIDEAANRNHE